MQKIQALNILSSFLGKRDLNQLDTHTLQAQYSLKQADIIVLFGGTVLAGADVFAHGIANKIAKTSIIVGGIGHTTEFLRGNLRKENINFNPKNMSEAEMLNHYLQEKYHFSADYLETASSNCGNNITNLLKLITQNSITFNSIIMIQDASMQRRMDATLKKFASKQLLILNYAAYTAQITEINNQLFFTNHIHGMWSIQKYISLLLGEMVRLKDDSYGYGPMGKDFIAHVDIPKEVNTAFKTICNKYPHAIRKANSTFR